MRSVDGTDLALAVASVSSEVDESIGRNVSHHVYILYLQGCFPPSLLFVLIATSLTPGLRKRLVFTASLTRPFLDPKGNQDKL